MSRYIDRARAIAEAHGAGIEPDNDLLADAIVKVIREFVEHDMEWAAVALEGYAQQRDNVMLSRAMLMELAESFRARGREA